MNPANKSDSPRGKGGKTLEEKGAEKETRVEAVERALMILNAFHQPGEQLALAEITRRTGFYKSTILRLAASLIHFGFLVRLPTGAFMLGPELPRLASLCAEGTDLEALIRPKLRELVAATQETASFYVRQGTQRVVRFRENSPRKLRFHLEEGDRLAIDRGASGHVLLAFGKGPHSPSDLTTREQGYYVSIGERDSDVAAVSVPLFDAAGRLLGALAVSGLKGHFDEKFQALALGALQAAAKDLHEQICAASPVANRIG